MLIWIIPIAVFIGFLVIQYFNCGIDEDDILMSFFFGFLALLVTFLVSAGVCVAAEKQLTNEDPIVEPIYAINDVYLQHNESKYVYFTFEEGKGLIIKEVCTGTSNSYINYTTDTPYVEIYEREVRNPVIRFLFQTPGMFSLEYHFYIPETAEVTNDFIIDLQ